MLFLLDKPVMNLTTRALPVALILTASLTGCGGGSGAGASPKAWSSALCGGLGHLKDDEASLEASFTAQASKVAGDPAGSKKVFVDAINTVRADFTASITALKKVGNPAVTNGPAIQKQVLEALGKGEMLFVEAHDALNGTDPTAAALATSLRSVGTTLQAGGTSLQTAFEGIDKLDTSKKLDKAATANKDCDAITKG